MQQGQIKYQIWAMIFWVEQWEKCVRSWILLKSNIYKIRHCIRIWCHKISTSTPTMTAALSSFSATGASEFSSLVCHLLFVPVECPAAPGLLYAGEFMYPNTHTIILPQLPLFLNVYTKNYFILLTCFNWIIVNVVLDSEKKKKKYKYIWHDFICVGTSAVLHIGESKWALINHLHSFLPSRWQWQQGWKQGIIK